MKGQLLGSGNSEHLLNLELRFDDLNGVGAVGELQEIGSGRLLIEAQLEPAIISLKKGSAAGQRQHEASPVSEAAFWAQTGLVRLANFLQSF
jgi:hypothetical protein